MTSFYITPAKTYPLEVDKFVCNKFGIAEFFANSIAASPIVQNLKTLDVGCGVGPLMILLSDQYSASVTGVEFNADACRCCGNNINRFNLSGSCDVFSGSFSSFVHAYPEAVFDLIVSNPPLDEHISVAEISHYDIKDLTRPDKTTFSYMTNSWHDNAGKDLLDQIFEYAITNLAYNGSIAIAFCEIDGADFNIVSSKAIKLGFRVVYKRSGLITPTSIGAEKTQTSDIIAHYVVFKRSNGYGD